MSSALSDLIFYSYHKQCIKFQYVNLMLIDENKCSISLSQISTKFWANKLPKNRKISKLFSIFQILFIKAFSNNWFSCFQSSREITELRSLFKAEDNKNERLTKSQLFLILLFFSIQYHFRTKRAGLGTDGTNYIISRYYLVIWPVSGEHRILSNRDASLNLPCPVIYRQSQLVFFVSALLGDCSLCWDRVKGT